MSSCHAAYTVTSPPLHSTHELVEVDEHEGHVAVPLGDAHEDEVVVLHVHERHPLHSEHWLLLHLIPFLDVVAAPTSEKTKQNTVSVSAIWHVRTVGESAMDDHISFTRHHV